MRTRLTYALFLIALASLGVWFVWPIYQDLYLLVTAGVALAVGATIGALKARRNFSILTMALSVLLSFVLLALPLSNPRALVSTDALLPGLLEALAGPVQAWKQIITIELPVGTYHALLSPVLVLFLLTGLLFGWIYFSKIARYWFAAGAVLAIVIFAISFGLTTVPGDFQLLSFRLPIETPLVTGGVLFITLVVYLNWGARATRRQSMLVRNESLGTTGNLLARKLRRTATAFAVVLLAVAVTTTSMQLAGVPSNRVVLRTGIEKIKHLKREVSPLSGYRNFFNDPTLLTSKLLTYSAADAPTRIRIATMPFYDGESFTVEPTSDSGINDNSLFSRLPSELPPTSDGARKQVAIELGNLGSIWVPLVDGARRVSFAGANSAKLSDALFVNRNTFTAAVIRDNKGPVISPNGAKYVITYNESVPVIPEDITPSSASGISEKLIPASLLEWLGKQSDISVTDGAGLQAIAKRLRDRGYLSHSLTEPTATESQVTWISLTEGIKFERSTAGHNKSRIEKMFADLITKQDQSNGRNLVGTAGDDEQFATAIALIASAKGFPARVVTGFRTGKSEPIPGVPFCEEQNGLGTCTGINLTAWAEVQGSNGQWMAIDATPQFEMDLSLNPPPSGTPENPTSAGENAGGVLPPGKASPSQSSDCKKDPKGCPNPDDFWAAVLTFIQNYVWPAIQVLLVVSVFVGPFAIVLLMKRRRRHSRRDHDSEFARVVGAWEEFVDTSIDYGAPMPRALTRLEYAKSTGSLQVLELAEMANMMAYGSSEIESVDISETELEAMVERSWEIFDSEFKELHEKTKRFNQIRAALSLRSFLRVLKPKDQLQKLRGAMNFTQGSKISDGSMFVAGWQALIKLIPKRKPKK